LRAHEAIRLHNEIFRLQVAAHGGYEVKSLGDGFMIVFSSARQGVRCAIALQKAFAIYRDGHPDMPLQVRIGLHVGEAISDSADLFGGAVIFAARVAAAARGGQILASSMLRDLTVSAGDLRFAPAGEKEFKGCAGKHPVFEVIW
jgi:class 3 adenylate cyclase